MKNVYWNWGVR